MRIMTFLITSPLVNYSSYTLALFCSASLFVGCSEIDLPAGDEKRIAKAAQAPEPSETPKNALGSILCLTTETYPSEGVFEDRLLREIVRQGVLIAGRDELGMLTRDQTLGEPFPASESPDQATQRPVMPLSLRARFDKGTKESSGWQATLRVENSPQQLPVWQHKGAADADPLTRYPQLIAEITAATPSIAEQLTSAGAAHSLPEPNAENVPAKEIESLLGEMNFVSQYAAARAAHQSIRDKGASAEWLGVLVRAYSHLSILTTHTWSSHGEAFAARSLLYAERMLAQTDHSADAHWHRAYAYAVLGLHALALQEHDAISKMDTQQEPPTWSELVKPIARYNHDAVAQVGQRHPELEQTAALHQWNLYYAYLHGRWVYEKGTVAMEICPEAYGIYSALANWSALRIKRVGSGAGIATFGEALPRRVATIEGLPAAVQPLVVIPAEWIDRLGDMFGQRGSSYLSSRPLEIAKALEAATNSSIDDELSWAVLGQLIAEEQFTQVADMLRVSRDGVEHSKRSLIERVRPLVEGHRFAAYVESQIFPYHQKREIYQELLKLTIKDPRAAMSSMLSRTSGIHLSDGLCGGQLAVSSARNRTLTVPTLLAAYKRVALHWKDSYPNQDARLMVEHFSIVSPHSPQARRAMFDGEQAPNASQLKQIEAQINEDPIAWLVAANKYKQLEDYDNAIRCYRRSLEISPCLNATQSLAALYYSQDDKESWETTLESYLNVEDLSLTHAQIHQQLAKEQIANRDWKAAKPHAIEAANTYSAWGLLLGARVAEGLQSWDASEHYFSAASQSYPSGNTGTEWYFWCHRTGRGDLEASRVVAAKSIEVAENNQIYDSQLRVALFRWLDDDLEGALAQIEGPLQDVSDSKEPWTHVYNLLVAAAIAVDLEDESAIKRCVSGIRSLLETDTLKQYPNWIIVFNGLCDTLTGKEPSAEFLAKYDQVLAETTPAYRYDYSYFLGVALEHVGKTELADKYYGIPAFQVAENRYSSTLAGRQLVARHGSDRGGLPEVYAKIEAANDDAKASQEEANANNPDAAEEESAAEAIDEPTVSEPADDKTAQLSKVRFIRFAVTSAVSLSVSRRAFADGRRMVVEYAGRCIAPHENL